MEQTETSEISSFDLVLIDDDDDLTKQIEAVVKEEGFTVKVFHDFKQAKEALGTLKYSMLLVDINSGQEVDGYGIMQGFIDNPESRSTAVVAFLSATISLEEKYKAINYPVDFYIEKPVDFNLLLEQLRGLHTVSIPDPTTILLIDDDTDFTKLAATLNDDPSVKLIALNEPDTLYDVLISVPPDMIILDYNMPEYKGSELIAMLRNDISAKDIPILLVSGENSAEMFQELAHQPINGFLTKPISPEQLLQTTRDALRKQQFLTYLAKIDPILGILSHYELQHVFQTTKNSLRRCVFISFNISGPALESREGAGKKKQFIDQLKNYFSSAMPIGSYSPTQIVIQCNNYTEKRIKLLVDDFLRNADLQDLQIEVGFAQWPRDGNYFHDLIQHAASTKRDTIDLTVTKESQEITSIKTRTLMISPDNMLRSVLSHAISQWNTEIIYHEEATQGIEWLRSVLFKEEPNVIVLDFDLPYENGPLMIEKLGNLVGNRIPILVLSSQSYGNNLSSILETGLVSFIRKPFDLDYFATIYHEATY